MVVEDTIADNDYGQPNQIDGNNYSFAAVDVVSTRPDLEVVSVIADAAGVGGTNFRFSYRVENRGDGPASGSWVDRVYLTDNPDPLARDARSILLVESRWSGTLEATAGYDREFDLLLSPSARGLYVVAITDAGASLRESDDANNRRRIDADVVPVPADLKVTSVSFEPETLSGERTVVRYTVTNIGGEAVWPGTQYWRDFLWVSTDPTFDRMRASYMGETSHLNTLPLAPGASYEVVTSIVLPKGAGGHYYLHIHLDAHNDRTDPYGSRILRTDWWPGDNRPNAALLDEFSRWAHEDPSNNLSAHPFTIAYREPDLRVTNLVVPAEATSGRTIPVSFTIANTGIRATREGDWVDRVFLSRDASLDNKDLELGSVSRSGALGVGDSYAATLDVTLPEGIEGSFYLLIYADAAAKQDSSGFEKSDIGHGLIGLGLREAQPARALGPGPGGVAKPGSRPRPGVPGRGEQHRLPAPADHPGRPAGPSSGAGRRAGSDQPRPAVQRLLHRDQPRRGDADDAGRLDGPDLPIARPVARPGRRPLRRVHRAQGGSGGRDQLHGHQIHRPAQRPVGALVRDLRHRPDPPVADRGRQGGLGPDPSATIPTTRPGRYYVLVRGYGALGAATPITVTAATLPLAISGVRADVGGDGRYVTVVIRGSKFGSSG